jgi:hypothetical protein
MSVWAYHSFSGAVEASNTSRYAALSLMPSPTFAHGSSLVGWLTNEASHGAPGLFIAHADDSPVRHCSSVCSNRSRVGFLAAATFRSKLTPFLFAVAATVWYAGTGPGVLAIVLSVLSLNYLFLQPFFPSAQLAMPISSI